MHFPLLAKTTESVFEKVEKVGIVSLFMFREITYSCIQFCETRWERVSLEYIYLKLYLFRLSVSTCSFKGIVSRDLGTLFLFHRIELRVVIGPDQVYFSFNNVFMFKF
jgi:hypothetical protein